MEWAIFQQRIPKVVLPFLIWSLIAVAYYAVLGQRYNGSVDWSTVIKRLKNLPSHATTIHLWFMYALIPLYVLSPILKKLVNDISKSLVIYMLII